MHIDSLVADIIIALILLTSAVFGAKRGIFRSVLSLAVLILAIWGAGVAAKSLSTPVTDWIFPKIEQSVEKSIEKKKEAEDQPKVTGDVVVSYVNAAVDDAKKQTARVVSTTAYQLTNSVVYGILFILAFAVLFFILHVIGKIINKLLKLPGLNFINGTLGFLLGAAEGVLLVFLLIFLIEKLHLFEPVRLEENSYLLAYFLHNTPFTVFGNLLYSH